MFLLLAIIGVIIAIILLSLPMYFASIVVVNKRTANFGNAIAATIITAIIIIFIAFVLHFMFAPLAAFGNLISFLLTLLILLYAYSSIYNISLGRSFILAIAEIIMWFIFFLFTGILGAFFIFI